MAEQNTGKITQIIGAVLDIKFSQGHLPEINDAINITMKEGTKLVAEVSQHLGDDTVRCIAMGPTDGLVRGMDAVATGAPITVPVGENTLGRIFNVLGDPIDNQPKPEVEEYLPIHRKAPSFEEQSTETEILETGMSELEPAFSAIAGALDDEIGAEKGTVSYGVKYCDSEGNVLAEASFKAQ